MFILTEWNSRKFEFFLKMLRQFKILSLSNLRRETHTGSLEADIPAFFS